MTRHPPYLQPLSSQLLLRAYSLGIFPMAKTRLSRDIYWVEPPMRGVLPLNKFHISRKLMKILQKNFYYVTCNQVFSEVIERCADSKIGRIDTWINQEIKNAVNELHSIGYAHSIETWRDEKLVGGLYGVAIGGAFFGESMFSSENNASKIALANLVARLRFSKFKLLDIQFVTQHLLSFGAIEITSDEYLTKLNHALKASLSFPREISQTNINTELDLLYQASRSL